jgi:ketosteroid isomerase-like protein
MGHPNEDLLRKGYSAFMAGNIETVLGILDESIVWNVPGRSPIAGTYKGPQEVLGFFGKLAEHSGGTFSLDVVDICANDTYGYVNVRGTATRDGKSIDQAGMHVWRIVNGKAVEFLSYTEDQYVEDEFFS